MSVKVCLLRTGETIIGDVKEVIDPTENKSLGYKLQHPYVIDYKYETTLKLKEDNASVEGSTNSPATYAFRSWSPLAAEREFNLQFDFIDCIYDPHAVVLESYNTIVGHYLEEHTNRVTVDSSQTIVTQGVDIGTEFKSEE